jgi:two-component system, OmpR family, sensor histidine kinase KdpD
MRKRGHHKVFIGMAAGVGKTYSMLQEAHADQDAGRDVCVGVLETHGREETARQAAGLEILPRRAVSYRESTLSEMDLPGILARRPDRVLIDELAHTNAPGLEHEKRFEDVLDVLAAGIDVRSTVNIQHLESLNDQIAELSGVRVHETLPDRIVTDADEVVIIDVTPEALLARLRAGKIYPAARIEPALNGFFKIENLTALREVALRQVAEDVAPKRTVLERDDGARDRVIADVPRAVGERLLALVQPEPAAQRLIRRSWRSAQRLGATLDLLWVRRPGATPTEDEERQLASMRRLASVLGVTLLIEEDDDVAAGAARVANEQGSTYLMIGQSRAFRGLRRLREPLPQKLMRLLPGVDLRIVADRAHRDPTREP